MICKDDTFPIVMWYDRSISSPRVLFAVKRKGTKENFFPHLKKPWGRSWWSFDFVVTWYHVTFRKTLYLYIYSTYKHKLDRIIHKDDMFLIVSSYDLLTFWSRDITWHFKYPRDHSAVESGKWYKWEILFKYILHKR